MVSFNYYPECCLPLTPERMMVYFCFMTFIVVVAVAATASGFIEASFCHLTYSPDEYFWHLSIKHLVLNATVENEKRDLKSSLSIENHFEHGQKGESK